MKQINYTNDRSYIKGNEWTKEEVELLIKEYPHRTREELLALFPNKTYRSIYAKRNRLVEKYGIKLKKEGELAVPSNWTEEELKILKENYKYGRAKVYALLPHRSHKSINMKSFKLGLIVSPEYICGERITSDGRTYFNKGYSSQEEEKLKSCEGKTIEEICALFPNHSKTALQKKMNSLGISWKKDKNFVDRCNNRWRKFYENNPNYRWSEEEIKILTDNYSTMGRKIITLLPNKTISVILDKARELHLKVYRGTFRKVVCVELRKTFNSVLEASEYIVSNVFKTDYVWKKDRIATISGANKGISKALKNDKHISYGYHWLDESKYLKMNEEEINALISTTVQKPIRCVELRKVFNSTDEIITYFSKKDNSDISVNKNRRRLITRVCSYWSMYFGFAEKNLSFFNNDKRLKCFGYHFVYEEDYKRLSQSQINSMLTELTTIKRIYCVETKKSFESINAICKKMFNDSAWEEIKKCCLGEIDNYKGYHFHYIFTDNLPNAFQNDKDMKRTDEVPLANEGE